MKFRRNRYQSSRKIRACARPCEHKRTWRRRPHLSDTWVQVVPRLACWRSKLVSLRRGTCSWESGHACGMEAGGKSQRIKVPNTCAVSECRKWPGSIGPSIRNILRQKHWPFWWFVSVEKVSDEMVSEVNVYGPLVGHRSACHVYGSLVVPVDADGYEEYWSFATPGKMDFDQKLY